MSKMDKLKEIIRELVRKELEEATVTGNMEGGEGSPKTPYAFGNKKKKKKEISTNSTGYDVVKEEITDAGYLELGKRGHNLPRAAKQFITALRKKDDREIEKYIDIIADLMKWMQTTLKNPRFNESINETPQMAKQGQVGLLLKLANKQLQNVFSLHKKGKNKEAKVVFNNKVYSTLEYIHRAFDNVSESINEGKYHDYRNDESMTPKQKIGRSMREVRDGLQNLERLVKMNVKLKNELNVNSGSYWKNTHKALHKISERLVKLANKVGQLQ